MASFSSSAFDSVNAFSVNAFDFGGTPPVVVTVDKHDGFRDESHIKEVKRREAEFREARDALRAQIIGNYELATGEVRMPEPAEIPALEKKAGQLPKAERPAYRRNILQMQNWQKELAEVERVMATMQRDREIAEDDEEIMAIIRLLP